MIVAGYDSGLHAGVGIVDCGGPNLPRILCAETLHTDPDMPLLERLGELFKALERLVNFYNARAIAIENPEGAQVAQEREGRSTLGSGRVMATVGVAVGVGKAYGLDLVSVMPQQAKSAVLGPGWKLPPTPELTLEQRRALGKKLLKEAIERLPREKDIRFSAHSADGCANAIAGERILRLKRRAA